MIATADHAQIRAHPRMREPWPADNRSSFWITFAVAALVLSFQLGVRGLNEPDEGRYASVAWEMVRSGNWLEPHFQGLMHMAKPPLTQWLMAASFLLFGAHEWSARLVPALAALGTVLLTRSLAATWYGPGRALETALILVTAPLFFIVAHIADINMLLTFWVTLGFWAWIRWQEEGRPHQRLLLYAAFAAAFLTKGPVGCILILFAALAFRLAGGDCMPRRRTWWWPGALFAGAVGLSWYLAVIARHPDLLDYFLRYELFDRVFTNVHKRGEPFWFFWLVLPAGFLPWLPLLAPLLRGGRARLRAAYPAAPLLLFLGLLLAFFTLARSKLATYVVPAYPALALLATSQLAIEDGGAPRCRRRAIVTVVLLAFATPVLLMLAGKVRLQWDHLLHSANLLALGVGLSAAVWLWMARRGRWIPAAALLVATSYATLLDIVRRHEDALGSNSSARSFVRRLNEHAAACPGPVYFLHAPSGTEFYLQSPEAPRRLPVKSTSGPLTPDDYLRQLEDHVATLPDSNAYLVVSTHYLRDAVASNRLPDGVEILEMGRKYAQLRVRAPTGRLARATVTP